MTTPNETLTEIFKKERLCSLEVSYQNPMDYKLLKTLKFSFLAVIWMGTYNKPVEQIDPLVLAKELIRKGYTVLLHIAGRNNTRESCRSVLDYAKKIGVRNLLTVRGATPDCKIENKQYDFPHAPDFIKFIKANYGDYFDIVVAGYPYKHPESVDYADDMKYLKEKNEAGAKYILTQAAFTFEIYKQFLANCRKHGINMRIIPGVYIIKSFVDFCFLQKLCKVPQSDPIVSEMKKIQGNDQKMSDFGLRTSLATVKKLLEDKNFCPPHIYTMDDLSAIKEFIGLMREHE